MNLKCFVVGCLIVWQHAVLAQIDHWESVIVPADSWHYLVPNQQLSTTWTNLSFDDNDWNTGSSGFGYGDGDDATVLSPTISVFIRKEFQIIDINTIQSMILDMDYDDGFVAYLNGIEIARTLVSGSPPSFDQAADGLHEAQLYQGLLPDRYEVDKSLLINGANILAIEVHNESLTSSDLSAIPTLSLGLSTSAIQYRETPDWFVTPSDFVFTSSVLPIIIIETENSNAIQDEPRVNATMRIVAKGEGERNFLEDAEEAANLNFDGSIDIEIRGSSSQSLPKKQYAFTTYASSGSKANVSLLDMPAENDWILNGLAFDPSLIRDYLTYNLCRQMGNYTTRTQFCEVVINGDYQGLYVLQEKLKADDNRIDINKIDTDDNILPQLSGGYITKADKTNGDPVAWTMFSHFGHPTDFIHEVPSTDEVTSQQNVYIRSVFESLAATSATRNDSRADGYPSIIDLPSFIDFMLISELSANVDAYQFSTYFHKDRNGKLRAGPVWDANLTYGNDLFMWGFDRSKVQGWQFDNGDNTGPKFWQDLFDDPTYKCYLTKRWNELTQTGQPLNRNTIFDYIDQTLLTISEAVENENERWQTIENHSDEIENMKRFISERSDWIAEQLRSSTTCTNVPVPKLVITKIHYHPEEVEDFDKSDFEFIEITNVGTEDADVTGVYFGGTGLVYQFPAGTVLPASSSVMLSNESLAFVGYYGFNSFDEFSRSIDNGGQSLVLLDAYGNLIDEVTFDDNDPWPQSADGDGDFLSLIDPLSDNNEPANWEAVNATSLINVLSKYNLQQPVINIFPNPVKTKVNIASSLKMESLVIFDLHGKEVYFLEKPLSNQVLDLSHLQIGTYVLSIQTTHGLKTRKLIVE